MNASSRAALPAARRLVVKIGSSSLTRPDGHLDVVALRALVDVLAARRAQGQEVVLVTSGAIAAGIGPAGLAARPRDLATMQACAMLGQGQLVARYNEAFAAHGLQVGQALLTAEDTVRRVRYRNAQRSLEKLLALGVVPVVNENDAVTIDELRFGDNDRLAALVSHLVRADAMVLLTDVDGLHDAPPSRPGARRISHVADLADVSGIEVTARGSSVGTGGMVTKLESVRIATEAGVPVVLTAAANVAGALAGDDVGTFFAAGGKRTTARRLWIAHAARAAGVLHLDDGATRAVLGGRASLLPAGITRVEGQFDAGDPVELVGPDGSVVARGLVAYDAAELPPLLGRSTYELRDDLGVGYDREVVHRDDLVLEGRNGLSSSASAS
ncbi:glutamate 5-kinase [Isoptericola sp. CG 20/1183]|uniref:Glutamate 5-kinase n=1 Tax=Isoptericola halotolerans TaxID=300560 RepID=A0ABX5EEU1_9MICO|nr:MULTISPECIES: glutamate 5-kinase [Isoptericola]PRZ05131.1 glutamate 5-kinase [Isoptericola halotolerans]PRZ05869.1 glutamate 5-kinase [Isoptericola sp. CG 20/1183]